MRVEQRCLRVIVPALMYGPRRRARPRCVRAASRRARPQRRHDRARAAAAAALAAARSRSMAGDLDEGVAAGLGHERQDDHLGDAGGLPRARRAPASSTTAPGSNMAWGVATALLDAGRGPRAARAVRGGRGLAAEPWPSELHPRLLLLSNLFRDQLDRYGELELLADRWAELVERPGRPGALRAERRRPARGRPRAATASGVTYFGVEDDSQALPEHAARRRLEALPQLRPRLRLRRDLPRPHGPLPLPELRPGATGARRWRPRACELDGHERLARRAAHPAGPALACGCPSPASTTSTTPWRRPPPRSSWACRWRPSARRSRASAGPSGAWRRSRSAATRSRSCW